MSKAGHIERIVSYLGDGFIQLPATTPGNLDANGVSVAEFRTWIELAHRSLSSINEANKLTLIPENLLGSIVSNIEGARSNILETEDGKPDPAGHFNVAASHVEQLISQVAPYLNLIDSVNYRNLEDKVQNTLSAAEKGIEERKKSFDSLNKSTRLTNTKSQNLLKRISSGVLSENFGKLSNDAWNWLLMIGAAVLSIYAFIALLTRSNYLTGELVDALHKGNLNYGIFLAKWSLSIPYLVLLAIGLLELRSRIRLRDIYIFREKVAGSLDGYTEILLDKAGIIRNDAERSAARRAVIEFMIKSMLELTKTPSLKDGKQKVGLKAKDIVEADITNS